MIVGTYQNAGGVGGTHGFIYNPNNSANPFTPRDDPSATFDSTIATGINDAGQVVGQYSDGTGTHGLGTVGTEWQVVGFGDFSSLPGEGDMMMRNTNTGAFMVYDISNDQITSSSLLGTVGLEWQVAGFGPMNGADTSDMVLRNVNSGAFEYNHHPNNHITGAAPLGAVGSNWQLGRFAANSPTGSSASWAAPTLRPPSSCKQWPVSAAAAARAPHRMLASSMPTRHSRRF
jgi:hypothetical protein